MTSQTTNTKMRADQERVSHLLTDTVTLLCKNGLQFKTEMKVQGLLGITLDDEVFLVQIDKKFGDLVGADAVKVHVAAEQEEVTNNSISGSETSDVTSQSSRKRHRRKRRRSSASVESDVSANTKFPSKLEVKAEVVDADDDEDLVMLESDNKIGLHDKDTMRESYGVSYNADLGKLESNNYHDDTGQSLDDASVLAGGGGDQAGCSTWDDPLSVLTDQNSSMGPHSGREDMMDQQTMSTMPQVETYVDTDYSTNFQNYNQIQPGGELSPSGSWTGSTTNSYGSYHANTNSSALLGLGSINHYSPTRCRRRRSGVDESQKKYICGFPDCTKAYLSRNNLLHHQVYKHGRKRGEPGPVIIRDT